MTEFPTLTIECTDGDARAVLEKTASAYGFVPNLFGKMAHSPQLAEAYLAIGGLFSQSGLSPVEQHVVLMTVNRENGCTYCMAAHSAIADMGGIDVDITDALRDDSALADPRLEALRRFTRSLVQKRGWPSDDDLNDFLVAGYNRGHVMDVILGVGMKTLSNYTNHVAGTEVDDVFAQRAWSEPGG